MAVFTPVTFEQAARFWEAYGRGPLQALQPIAAGTENSNFFLQADRSYVLTLFERRTDPADLPYFVAAMQAAVAAGLPGPEPIAPISGPIIGTLCDRAALVVSKLPGSDVREPTPLQARAAGAMLARLQAAGQGLAPKPNPLGREALQRLAAQLQVAIALPDVSDLPVGFIHADYFPDNVLFLEETVSGIIDFYFACSDIAVYDLAVALVAWNDRAHDVLNGYRSVRPLSDAETAALPVLCRRAAARFYLTRLYDLRHPRPDALVQPKDPAEYLSKLHFLDEHPRWPTD